MLICYITSSHKEDQIVNKYLDMMFQKAVQLSRACLDRLVVFLPASQAFQQLNSQRVSISAAATRRGEA